MAPDAVNKRRPGRVTAIRGILFQYDHRDAPSDWIVHPFEQFDRRLVGLKASWRDRPPLAVHTGLLVEVETPEGSEARVAEQLFGQTPLQIFSNLLSSGLHWTPLAEVERRDHGGWHLIVPATAFRRLDQRAERAAVERLNRIKGRSFLDEDCTAFVERAFGGQRLFADSPLFQKLGLPVRIGDPALPLLRPDARLDARTERLLRTDALRRLPDPRDRAGRLSAARRVSLALAMLLAATVGAWVGDRLGGRYLPCGRRMSCSRS